MTLFGIFVPVGGAFANLPLLDALQWPLRADRHADVAAAVGVKALGGGGAFGALGPAGVKDPRRRCVS